MFRRADRPWQVPPKVHRWIKVERGLKVPMRDGVVLSAERWTPRAGASRGAPVAFLRSPYPLSGVLIQLAVKPLVRRGFQVVLQRVRGTGTSEGTFVAMAAEQERLDGLDTIDWIARQSWFGDRIVLFGPSYNGFVQWAMADALPDYVVGMVPTTTSSTMSSDLADDGVLQLESAVGWGVLMEFFENRWALTRFVMNIRRISRAMSTLPVVDADLAIFGRRSPIMQRALAIFSDPELLTLGDCSDHVAGSAAPVSANTGWHDIFLRGALRDHEALQDAGRPARLIVGDWSHTTIPFGVAVGEVAALSAAPDSIANDATPVKLFVMGKETWEQFPSWPPAGYEPHAWYLNANGWLAQSPDDSSPDMFTYDPSDPTPTVGGARLLPGVRAGRVDNRKIEARDDVLVYTSEPLESPLEVIGHVIARVWFQSSLPYADVFVRLCEVDRSGRSRNITDGITRVAAADHISEVVVNLAATAFQFKAGDRLRVQVSSGAFPMYERNSGTGEPFTEKTELRPAHQTVFHDVLHPSAVILPTSTR